MTNRIFAKLLLLQLFFFALAPFCFPQNSNSNPPANQNTEVMGEDEHLPFMQNEQTAATEEPSSGGLMIKTLGALLLIVGLIFFGAWGAKKLGFGNSNSKNSADDLNLAILTSVSLGSGRTISTVRFGERILLVGSTAQTFTLLAEEKSEAKTSLLKSRSVAEMLNDEIIPFDVEFDRAQTRLNLEDGEQI
ncbi:MAG: flagellar biosynthetic protein FliO [Actinomycetota bacterium]